MKPRHRTPSIFTLSMVDVLCCALGCVILLWLMNLREAKNKAALAGRSDEEIVNLRLEGDDLRRELDEAKGELGVLRSEYATTAGRLRDAEKAASEAGRRVTALEGDVRDAAQARMRTEGQRDEAALRAGQLEKELLALRKDKSAADEALVLRRKDVVELERKLDSAGERIAALMGQLRERGTELTAANRRADDLSARVKEARDEAKGYREKLADDELALKALEKEAKKRVADNADRDRELAEYRKEFEGIETERKQLRAEVARAREAADKRFAGIALTGKRVVFLVDMSGSMDEVAYKVPAPDKWPSVRRTLLQIMRSLPDLEKYQVILFSSKVSYLLGTDGAWLDYDARTSPTRVEEEMKKISPDGGTNMYDAFRACFALRPKGLDTIYLLSDGLPNQGEGVPAEQARDLKETELSERLGRYIRNKLKNDWNPTVRDRERVRINAVGFFYESPDVGAFLWALTRENEGSFVGMSKP
jgi:predicted  nucleic acid-binding Zn-ribbon protein